jgi:hypothetical protein
MELLIPVSTNSASLGKRIVIRLYGTPSQFTGFALQEKDGAYLTPHGRMGSLCNAATFDTARVARLVFTLWVERLQARWGAGLRIELELRSGLEPSDHAALLAAKALAKRFASNQGVSQAQLEVGQAWLSQEMEGEG